MAFIRQGTCNQCGQCCGADGSPNQASPWPRNWLTNRRNHQLSDWLNTWPQGLAFGLLPGGTGKPVKSSENGTTRIAGGGAPRDYHWVWVEGRPCKDVSFSHDGSSHSLECPFLMDDPGDGTRPCGLVGTNNDNDFKVACDDRPGRGIPPYELSQEAVDDWMQNHPLCSFEWR